LFVVFGRVAVSAGALFKGESGELGFNVDFFEGEDGGLTTGSKTP